MFYLSGIWKKYGDINHTPLWDFQQNYQQPYFVQLYFGWVKSERENKWHDSCACVHFLTLDLLCLSLLISNANSFLKSSDDLFTTFWSSAWILWWTYFVDVWLGSEKHFEKPVLLKQISTVVKRNIGCHRKVIFLLKQAHSFMKSRCSA